MTLELPEAAVWDALAAFRAASQGGVVGGPEAQIRAALAAVLPHLRSLQVETQDARWVEFNREIEQRIRVAGEYGRALGRAEALSEVRGALIAEGATQRAIAIVTSLQASNSLQQAADATTSEPRTDPQAGPSHPQDPEAAREAL